ncbi:hypothetical protein BKA70DRAFT_1272889, partial [Coprinopsis sp. MPI-PUGE-AT-0042]
SRSKHDLYKQNLNLTFQNALIRYVENEGYVESMTALGAILHDRVQRYNDARAPTSYSSYKSFTRLWKQVGLFELVLQYFSERRQQRAFQRSLAESTRLRSSKKHNKKQDDEETPIGIDFSTHEYALELTYFVDVVGEVPPLPHADPFSRGDLVDVGNGDTAPEWGVNLLIKGGTLRYGPWADRQRAELQRAFFPPSYYDMQTTNRLEPGDKRLWTTLQVFIELRDSTTLHIPFREASKDWQWDGKTEIPKRPKKREPASINVTVGDRSSINYIMPMVIGSQGYEPIVEIHLDTVSVASSLNDIKLIEAETCRVRCEQPSPVSWNETRTWTYSITLRQPVLYLLRDHINMFTDLGKDWASGPPTDYQKFVPMIYRVKPLARQENALLILKGQDLETLATIASDAFRPPDSVVPFTVYAPNLSIDLSVPRWSTHALHQPEGGYSLLKAEHFHLASSYRYHSDYHEEHVDQLKLDIQVRKVAYKAFGWSIRYFMVIKDNYFGSFTHFSTLYEFLSKRQSRAPLGDPTELKYRDGKVCRGRTLLGSRTVLTMAPAGLLGYRTSPSGRAASGDDAESTGAALMLTVPRLSLYLRLHDYFMEMTLNVDTIRGRVDCSVPEKVDYRLAKRKSKEVLMIDGIDVVANRLFGPRPHTATYLCVWEISLGNLWNPFCRCCQCPRRRVTVASAELTWQTPTAALVISLERGVKFDSNDLAAERYRKVMSVQIPRINVKVLVTSSPEGTSWLEAGDVVADASLDIYDAPKDYEALNKAQTEYVEEQDRVTKRLWAIVSQLRSRGHKHNGTAYYRGGMFHADLCYSPGSTGVQASVQHKDGLGRLSDSDGDDALSEADRDAYVAKSRMSISRPIRISNEEIMSSGDESDNVDLTDGDSVDSDWSDSDDIQATASTMLSFYSSLTPSNGPTFSLTRDQLPLRGQRGSFHGRLSRTTPWPIGIRDDEQKEVDRTVPSDPETMIDALLASYLPKVLEQPSHPSFLMVDVAFPFIGVCILHHIPTETARTSNLAGCPPRPKSHPTKLDTTALLDISLANVSVSFGKLGHQLALRASLESLTSRLDVSLDKRTLSSSTPTTAIFDVALTCMTVELVQKALKFNVDDVFGRIGHRGPAIILATAKGLSKSMKATSAGAPKLTNEHEVAMRTAIYAILQASSNKSIVDTLSTIQPSYLVQAGSPSLLRRDLGFRFLFHLRSCIDTHPSATSNDPTPEEFLSLLNSRLSVLEQDSVNVAENAKLLKILPVPNPNPWIVPETHRNSHIDSINISASELRLTDVQFNAKKERLELVQLSHPAVGISQTSLRERPPRDVKRFAVSLLMGDANLAVFPQLMGFIQESIRVKKKIGSKEAKEVPRSPQNTQPNRFSQLSSISGLVSLRRLRVRAAAENLVFELGLVGLKSTSAMLRPGSKVDTTSNHVLVFEEIYLQARSPSSPDKETQHDILAAISLRSGKLNYISKFGTSLPGLSHRLVFSISRLRLEVPRSAMRLYRFAEEWRADYLPGIESAVKEMLSEMEGESRRPTPGPSRKPTALDSDFHVAGSIDGVGVVLQVMHGTWLTWEMEKIVGYSRSPVRATAVSPVFTFGTQAEAPSPSSRVRLVLPPLSVAGHYDGSCIHTLALVDFIELKVKPSHWDTLLAVQQKFGQDFNDLLNLVQQTKQDQAPPSSRPRSGPIHYGVFVKMKGFRIGLEGLSSTLYLECVDIRGGVNNSRGLSWDVALTGLALSLAPRALGGLPRNRVDATAFVSIDFKINGNDDSSRETLVKTLNLAVTKVHAVMQPSSIGEVGDFIDHLQAEMIVRQEQRAVELAAFKEKTQSIIKTFDDKVRDSHLKESSGWLGSYIVDVSIRNLGIAFPLAYGEFNGMHAAAGIKAFLFSIRSITFKTDRGETGEALMDKLCFQFVPRFRQSCPDDFASERHHARNCLVYPQMKAHIHSSTNSSSRKIWINANVDGFLLDLDSTIPDYVFSLIDVYRQGKERVERLSATVPRTPITAPVAEFPKPYDKGYTSIPTSNVFASLRFSSGKVRAYSGSAVRQFRSRTLSLSTASQDLTDEQVLDMGAEVFNLPTLSVWAEYRATAAPRATHGTDVSTAPPSLLMFKSTVHSSRNTLRPKLIPFLTEVMHRVEARMRTDSSLSPVPSPVQIPADSSQLKALSSNSPVNSSLQLSFSLRIDQSKLELTCQPDVNVVAALNWESGGFTLNVSPGAKEVSFTGAVGGLAIGLRHGFLSEDCVNLDARNLAFSVSFKKMESLEKHSVSVISAIIDTEFLGGVRFSRLQDILCFKAVWLDRIPMWNSTSQAAEPQDLPKSTPANESTPTSQDLSTVILVRIRQIKISVDLGQSISLTVLDLKNAVLRSKLTDRLQEVSLLVEEVTIDAKGNISGHIHVGDCVFQTNRRSGKSALREENESKMLELKMTSGPLIAVLESDHQKLLHYRAEPLAVHIFDDWSSRSMPQDGTNRPLRLSFVVDCPELALVATVSTIPKLITYANKFKANLEAQRQGASRESKTYLATRNPKPDNPLSAVAEAMLHSARSRFKDMDYGLGFVVQQRMRFKLDLLRLVVFPRSMNDVEIAQFIGREVTAHFDRLVGLEMQPAKRELRLAFSSMTISKHTQNHAIVIPSAPLESFDSRGWLEDVFKDAVEATIVGLPAMTMHMTSEEAFQGTSRLLIYDFKSQFVRKEGMKAYEDIFITLNMSLYTWLTFLRKNLAREVDQVRTADDWRTAQNSGQGHVNRTTRKPPPEPLDLSKDEVHGHALEFPPSSSRLNSIDQSIPPPAQTQPSIDPSANLPSAASEAGGAGEAASSSATKLSAIVYTPRQRHIERLTMRQLGEATPDVMHPFFMKKAGFNLEDSLPQYVHEYAVIPLEEIMEVLLKIYSQQLLRRETKDNASARLEDSELLDSYN